MDGLVFLKSKGIIHRDIKPGNILLMNDLSIRIIDFGLSREINTKKEGNSGKLERRLTKHIITRWYRPPEIILLEDY